MANTDLFNTHMYGRIANGTSPNRRFHNRNAENTIDDPIFTGFTFSIDNLHSPLFYTGNDDSPESLRKNGGNNTELSNKIESRLRKVYTYIKGSPDSYEINTISAKDYIDFTNEYFSGYGLQDKVYMDNILYGAMDYIYMVDKVFDSNVVDEVGVQDLGDGSQSSSIYDTYSEAADNAYNSLIEDFMQQEEVIIEQEFDPITGEPIYPDDAGDSDVTIDEDINTYPISKKIDNLEKKKKDCQVEHDKNEKEYDKKKSEYDAKYKEYLAKKEEYDKLSKGDKTIEVKINISGIQSDAVELYAKLKKNVKDTEITKKIEDLYSKFQEFKTKYIEKNDDVDVSTISETSTEESSVTEEDRITLSGVWEYATKLFEILKTKITGVVNSSSTQKEIDNLKNRLKELEGELYGEDSSMSNPSEGTLYWEYLHAKEIMDSDEFTQLSNQIDILEGAKTNYYDTIDYEEYKGTKTTNTGLKNPITKTVEKSTTTTLPTTEVPQTVYDILGFISGMDKLTKEYPYVMQSITGLDEAYKKYFAVKDPHMGSGDDKITISCYESLDLRISSMFNKYFNAVYDRQYRRERVPINLRRFNCSVFVHDIRNFRYSLNNLFPEGKDGDNPVSKIIEIALNSISAIEFKFYDCEIVPEETGSIFDNVSNESAGDMRRTNFSFTYGNCVINFLPFEDLKKYYKSNVDELNVKEHYNYDYGHESVDGNFRRWFDKSELGNVNNNDYRDYIRHDTSVVVDDYYKTSIVNNFAYNSLVNKNREITQLDDALRRMVMGISASTGIPTKGVTDALDIKFIDPIINKVEPTGVVTDLGNVYEKGGK